ncbi:MAG: DUF4340 domain-containing protein [Treponema sp.]|jgi:hypothetical protein|nr:DUF4340 domain-containing protein [Treponema sp.]
MDYKKKVIVLAAVCGALALVYAGTIVFSAERRASRSAAFAWLSKDAAAQADKITLRGSEGETELHKIGGAWVISKEGNDYPVKQERVDDFLALLSEKKAYPVQARSESAQEALGVSEAAAEGRIVIRGGSAPEGIEKPALLELLVGNYDAAGALYFRRAADKEIRSGESTVKSYLDSQESSWYNLALFPGAKLTPQVVQRIQVTMPPKDESADEGDAAAAATPAEFTLARQNGGWVREDTGETLDTAKVDSYLRAILDASGEDFDPKGIPSDPSLNEGRIVLSLGDNSSRTIRIGPKDEQGKRNASVSGSGFVYRLASWTVGRIFKGPEDLK